MKQYKFSQLPYEANDFEKIQRQVDDLAERIRSAASFEEALKCTEQFDDMM